MGIAAGNGRIAAFGGISEVFAGLRLNQRKGN